MAEEEVSPPPVEKDPESRAYLHRRVSDVYDGVDPVRLLKTETDPCGI